MGRDLGLRYSAVSWVVGDVLVPEVPMKRRHLEIDFLKPTPKMP